MPIKQQLAIDTGYAAYQNVYLNDAGEVTDVEDLDVVAADIEWIHIHYGGVKGRCQTVHVENIKSKKIGIGISEDVPVFDDDGVLIIPLETNFKSITLTPRSWHITPKTTPE